MVTSADREMSGTPKMPVLFWDTGGLFHEEAVHNETDSGILPTISNPEEGHQVEKVLTYFIQHKNVKRSSIGVNAPYQGQPNQICSFLMSNKMINPQNDTIRVESDGEEFSEDSKRSKIQYVSGILIASIDAFQGREKDFIVMSCVRSNRLHQSGFLSDRRRFNVALTRATYGLIIIGDLECLRKGSGLWSDYAEFLEESGCVLRSSEFQYG